MRRVGLVAAVVSVALAGCSDTAPRVTGLSWHEVNLPTATGGRPVIRDVATCPGHWYAVGGYLAASGSITPAIWASVDGQSWRSIAMQPISVYGPQHMLSAVACRGNTVVAIGSAAGGVHGNLRTGSWFGTDRGPLTEVQAPFELYGGPNAIGVGRLTTGPAGWLLIGARLDANGQAGGAVWHATDGRSFQLVDADPALESDPRGLTMLAGAAPDPDGGFVVVGTLLPADRPLTGRPVAWRSIDGVRWIRQMMLGTSEDDNAQAVVPYDNGLLAVGIRSGQFGAWRRSADTWHPTARFGKITGSALPQVGALVAVATSAYAVVSDGARYRLWHAVNAAHWSQLPMPVTVPAGGARTVRLASLDGRLLLAADNGETTHIWVTSPAG
jgi:hypothetical protein